VSSIRRLGRGVMLVLSVHIVISLHTSVSLEQVTVHMKPQMSERDQQNLRGNVKREERAEYIIYHV
jgi:hypothetical protein